MRRVFVGVLLFMTQNCHAVLPPYYQGKDEITAILNNDDVAKKITSGRVIKKIERTETGYQIKANECTLDVEVNYLPPEEGWVGPAKFTIEAKELICKNED